MTAIERGRFPSGLEWLSMPFVGLGLWLWFSLKEGMWLLTWLPTSYAALGYWFAIRFIANFADVPALRQRVWLTISSLLGGSVSVVVFSTVLLSLSGNPLASENWGVPSSEIFLISGVGLTGTMLGAFIGIRSQSDA